MSKKRYKYDKSIAVLKGFTALSCVAFLIAITVFAFLVAVYYVDSISSLVNFGELERAVNKIYLRMDAFLFGGLTVSLFGFILSAGLPGAVVREKGGFRSFVLMLLSAVLIVFYIVIMTTGIEYGYILNYAFGGILVVGILGFLLGITAFISRYNMRRRMERRARKFEKNYLRFEKYNR